MTTTLTGTCWADPLSRKERTEVAALLARACQRFYNIPAGSPKAMLSQIVASAEMSDLHLDVTERAEAPADPARETGRKRAAELLAASADENWLGI